MRISTFIFDSFKYDADQQTADFYYKTDAGHSFHEQLKFSSLSEVDYPMTALEQALQLYWFLAGTCYYKAHLASSIEFTAHSVDSWQAEQLNTIYRHGLAEFYYTNQLDSDAAASFFGFQDSREIAVSRSLTRADSLVLIGGGKDSLTTVALMDQLSEPFSTYRVNPQGWVIDQLSAIGRPTVSVTRTIDPFLTSDQPQLKGHVPITAIISASAVIAAILGGFKSVVLSNEQSADEPTLVDESGQAVNHQWSKGAELEKILQDWIHRYISQDLECYSYLRYMNELQVADVFSVLAFPQYRGLWSSSNENFKQGEQGAMQMTLQSSKTLSTFALLAPHIQREELIAEFGGNPFAISENYDMWQRLRGAAGQKPFECVAACSEIQTSLEQALATGHWPEVAELLK